MHILEAFDLAGTLGGAAVSGLRPKTVARWLRTARRPAGAATIRSELRDRFRASMAHDLSGIRLVTLFFDAIYLPVRPSGVKEECLAWGFTEARTRAALGLARDVRVRAGLATGDIFAVSARLVSRFGLPFMGVVLFHS